MQPNLTPETVEVLRQLVEHSKVLMEALADLTRQADYQFKKHPGREFMDRTEAMRNVMRIRDAHYRFSDVARQAIVTNGVPPSPVCYAELTECPTCKNNASRCVGPDKMRPPASFNVPTDARGVQTPDGDQR